MFDSIGCLQMTFLSRLALSASIYAVSTFSVTMAGPAGQENSSPPAITASAHSETVELDPSVKAPHTQIELLQNLKFALDRGLFLRRDFFTDEYQKRLVGANTFHWGDAGLQSRDADANAIPWQLAKRRIDGNAEDFGGMFVPLKVKGIPTTEGVDFHYRWWVRGDGTKVDGTLVAGVEFIINGGPGPRFVEIEQIFGKMWKRYTPVSTDGVYREPKGPHGNESIEYEIERGAFKEHLAFEFGPGGTLELSFLDDIKPKQGE